MPIAEYDIRTECGAHWRRNFNWIESGADAQIAGSTAQLTVRADFGEEALLILTDTAGITITNGNVYVEITPTQIGMVRDGLGLAAAQGPFVSGIYDLRLTYPDTSQVIFLSGRFIVRKSVTAQ